MARWLAIVGGIILLAVVVAACGSNDDSESAAPAAQNQETSTPENTPRPNVTSVSFIPVTATFTPSPTLTPTQTLTPLPFRSEDFVGSWSVLLDYDFSAVPGIAGIDTWQYDARVTVEVNETGLAIGRGTFAARVNDLECTISVLDDDDLDFFLSGQIRQDGEITYFDLVVEPDNPEAIERYTLICLGDEESRDVELNYLWSTVALAGLDTFSVAVSAGQRIVTQEAPIDGPIREGVVTARIELLR